MNSSQKISMSFIGSTKIPVSLVSFAPALCCTWCFKSGRQRTISSRLNGELDGSLEYIDNRSEHEVGISSTRISVGKNIERPASLGTPAHLHRRSCLVKTVGGDLTIKVENNTETGEGIYAEPVDNPDQQLDDVEIHYAIVGNQSFKIRPYQESQYRYVIFNGKIQQAMRLDDIEHACVMLPSDHGPIFPGGYYLQTGEFKRFDYGLSDMRYQRTIALPMARITSISFTILNQERMFNSDTTRFGNPLMHR